MSAASAPARRWALVLALAAAACGPYADVAQKLDVTPRVVGDTWIAAAGPDRSEIRILVVGTPDPDGQAPFAFTSIQMPVSRCSTSGTLQGTWTEVGSSGAATLHVEHTYTLPEEKDVALWSRRGSWRDDSRYDLPLTVTRDAGRLTVSGSAGLAGSYVPLQEALGRIAAAPEPAACAFQLANLGIRSSEVRIIGFGGPGMTQYKQGETYVGTIAGSVRVSLTGTFDVTTTIDYAAFEDLGGVQVSGPQTTYASSSGDGHMAGVMSFVLSPIAADGSALTPVTGTIDYGGAGVDSDAVQISGGTAVGGVYVTTIDGGATARVAPQTAPSPSVSDCLALP